jgi:hypothetical protein
MYTSGTAEQRACRLTQLVARPGVLVSENDLVMPRGFLYPQEAQLGITPGFLTPAQQVEVTNWWLQVSGGANTPNWDIAATATIGGKRGLVLVEAKAHVGELEISGKRVTEQTNQLNHQQIGQAIEQANDALDPILPGWRLSRDSHYQLSNRFAWSWKIASLGVPVVLVYLGFLNADEMPCPFQTVEDWAHHVQQWSAGIVPAGAWGTEMTVNGTTFVPLVRAVEVLFQTFWP